MQILDLKLNMVKPYNNNPRKNDKAVKIVAKSIQAYGFKVPIVIDADYNIVTGHTRLKAAEYLKLETVPCIMADDLTEAQIKAFRIADNKASEFSTWDGELLKIELESLSEAEFDLSLTGFDVKELSNILMPEEAKELVSFNAKGSVAKKCTCPECGHTFDV